MAVLPWSALGALLAGLPCAGWGARMAVLGTSIHPQHKALSCLFYANRHSELVTHWQPHQLTAIPYPILPPS